MKYWFYTEGESERQFIKWLFRKYFSNVMPCLNVLEFVNADSNRNIYYIHNCGSVDKIPYEISDKNHWVERSGVKKIFVICDIEGEYNCPIERRDAILDVIREEEKNCSPPVVIENISYIFSEPTLEEIYCFHKEISKNVLTKLYKRKYNSEPQNIDTSFLDDSKKSPIFRLKAFFQKHGLTYKETEFAENFFPQLDYECSANKTIKRLHKLIQNVI